MARGRKPDFLTELKHIKELWDLRTDMKSDLLKAERLIQIWAVHTTPPPGMILGWMQHEFPYPCYIFPLTTPIADNAAAKSGKIFANLCERPEIPPDSPFMSRHSRGGMLWIPFPGKWWLAYDGLQNTKLPCMVVDDTCGMAGQMASKEMCWISDSEVNVASPGPTNIYGGNPFADGVVIQNQGTVSIWVRPGTTGSKPAAVSTGLIVPAGETLDLGSEGLCYNGPLNGAGDGAACPVAVWEIFS